MSRSLDRYLYAIGALKEKYLCVRAVDVAHSLGVSKASVSTFIRQMQDQGLASVEQDGNLILTNEGARRSESLMRRVSFFSQLLTQAGVEPAQAVQDAISFGWDMSDASYEAFLALGEELKKYRDGEKQT